MHPDLAAALQAIRPRTALPTALVFPEPVTNDLRRGDYKRAAIPLQDDEGRWVDLHSARSWLGTTLARSGVVPQIAQRLLRHTRIDVTMRHYTKLELRDDDAAMRILPSLSPTAADAARATGTDGAADGERQQDRQQKRQPSLRETMRSGASRREDDGDDAQTQERPGAHPGRAGRRIRPYRAASYFSSHSTSGP